MNICNFAWVAEHRARASYLNTQRTKLDFAFISLQIGRCMLEPVPLEIVRGEERSHVTVFWFANQLYYSIWSLQACQSSELELFQKCEARNKEHENPFQLHLYLENMVRWRLLLSSFELSQRPIWRAFGNLKNVAKQCYQTGHFQLVENSKIDILIWDILGDF